MEFLYISCICLLFLVSVTLTEQFKATHTFFFIYSRSQKFIVRIIEQDQAVNRATCFLDILKEIVCFPFTDARGNCILYFLTSSSISKVILLSFPSVSIWVGSFLALVHIKRTLLNILVSHR